MIDPSPGTRDITTCDTMKGMRLFYTVATVLWMVIGMVNITLGHGDQHWLVSGLCFVAAAYYSEKT
jgi:hypothetical protein